MVVELAEYIVVTRQLENEITLKRKMQGKRTFYDIEMFLFLSFHFSDVSIFVTTNCSKLSEQ